MNLTDKTILITGAAGGLGQSLVAYCLNHDARKVICCARNTAPLQPLAQYDQRVELHPLDITDAAAARDLATSVGKIDILINNAGINSTKRVFDETFEDFDVNVRGTLNVCRAFEPNLSPGGAIITITSILALANLPVMGLYCASKSALHSLMQAMRAELVTRRIEVYEVLPGPIDTAMSEDLPMEKAAPSEIAAQIFDGYAQKTYEIYPDPYSQWIKTALENDPETLLLNFAASLHPQSENA